MPLVLKNTTLFVDFQVLLILVKLMVMHVLPVTMGKMFMDLLKENVNPYNTLKLYALRLLSLNNLLVLKIKLMKVLLDVKNKIVNFLLTILVKFVIMINSSLIISIFSLILELILTIGLKKMVM